MINRLSGTRSARRIAWVTGAIALALIPLEACYLGWQKSLRNLARLVEPGIKD